MSNALKFRVARPTDDIEALKSFYIDGLGLVLLGSFADHAGFDGIMLGHPEASYHLEFTRHHTQIAGKAPTQDNLLVFYIPNIDEWQLAVTRMGQAGYPPVPSFNPYWDINGRTFEDPDGYRVVLQNSDWPA